MKTTLAYFCFAALILALAVLFLWRPESPDPGPQDGGTPVELNRPTDPEGAVPQESLDQAGRRKVGSAPVFDPANDPLLAPLLLEGVLRVLVVAEEDGRPLPGALVGWRLQAEASQLRDLPEDRNRQPEDLILESGRLLEADEHGAVLLPRFSWTLEVAGRHGHYRGHAAFPQDQENPARLVLSETLAVEIQVVDAEGAPAPGIPVHLIATSETSAIQAWHGVASGPEGKAQAWFSPSSLEARLGGFSLLAGFPGPLAGEPLVAVDRLNPRTVRLVLPPTGQIVVRILEADGSQSIRPLLVSIESQLLRDSAPESRLPTQRVWVPCCEGVALFPAVRLGGFFQVAAHAVDWKKPWSGMPISVAGPTGPGQEVVATLQADRPAFELRGRLLEEGGQGLACQPVRVMLGQYFNPNGRSGHGHVSYFLKTDQEGRFRFELCNDPRVDWIRAVFIWRTTPVGGQMSGPWVEHDVIGPFASEGVDLGDLRLAGEPPVIAGVVRLPDGRPVPGAQIMLMPSSKAAERTGLRFAIDIQQGSSDEKGKFLFLAHQRVPFRLIVRGGLEEGARELIVSPGQRDLEVLLTGGKPTGSLEVQLAIPQDLTLAGLRIEAVGPGSSTALSPGEEPDIWRAEGLPAGSWNVYASIGGHRIAEVHSIEVRPNQTARDPRLQPWDLAGLLRMLRLRVHEPDGAPISSLRILFVAPGVEVRSRFETQSWNPQGRHAILVLSGTERFVVGCQGAWPLSVAWSPAEQEFVLRRGPWIRAVLSSWPGKSPGLAEVSCFNLEFAPVSPPGDEWENRMLHLMEVGSGPRWWIPSQETLLGRLPPGLYRCSLYASLIGKSPLRMHLLPRSSPGLVEIGEQEVQVLRIALDNGELLAARQE